MMQLLLVMQEQGRQARMKNVLGINCSLKQSKSMDSSGTNSITLVLAHLCNMTKLTLCVLCPAQQILTHHTAATLSGSL